MDFQSRETQTTPILPEYAVEGVESIENVDNGILTTTPATNSEFDALNEEDTESSPLTSSNEVESVSSGMETESTADLRPESTASLNDEAQPLVPQSSLSFTSIDTSKSHISWPFSSWEDGKRRSAFLPYKPTTILTNLQRGNIQAKHRETDSDDVTWFEKAGRGNISRLDIKNVDDINQVDSNGLTALMWSCAYGQTATVELLIEESANIHKRGHNLETALHLAAAGGHHDIIRVLLLNGADVNAEDKDGNSPLLFAVYGDHAHAVNELIENGCDLWEPNNFHVKAYNLAVEKNCTQARIVIEEYLKHLINKLL